MHTYYLGEKLPLGGNIEVYTLKTIVLHQGEKVKEFCLFDQFCDEIRKDGNLNKQLEKIYMVLERLANQQKVSSHYFKPLKSNRKKSKSTHNRFDPIYELRTKNLRIYITQIPEGSFVIVMGGKKTTQPKDIRKFIKISQQFHHYIF